MWTLCPRRMATVIFSSEKPGRTTLRTTWAGSSRLIVIVVDGGSPRGSRTEKNTPQDHQRPTPSKQRKARVPRLTLDAFLDLENLSVLPLGLSSHTAPIGTPPAPSLTAPPRTDAARIAVPDPRSPAARRSLAPSAKTPATVPRHEGRDARGRREGTARIAEGRRAGREGPGARGAGMRMWERGGEGPRARHAG